MNDTFEDWCEKRLEYYRGLAKTANSFSPPQLLYGNSASLNSTEMILQAYRSLKPAHDAQIEREARLRGAIEENQLWINNEVAPRCHYTPEVFKKTKEITEMFKARNRDLANKLEVNAGQEPPPLQFDAIPTAPSAAKSKCCRQSLSCGGALLMAADGGLPICVNCLTQLATTYDMRKRERVKK